VGGPYRSLRGRAAPLPAVHAERPEVSRKDVERILDMTVVMPGHLLRRRELELGDAEAGPLGMVRPALDGLEMASVLKWFHRCLHMR
jgi:hypothetical protein